MSLPPSQAPGSGWSLTRTGPVATLAFAGPPDNQVSAAHLRELRAVLAQLAADDVSVVVLCGARPGAFIGHAARSDIDAMRRGDTGIELLDEWRTALLAIEDLPQPVVAAVDGPALGGGCELALACTFRLAGPGATFCQMEITRGAIPGAGATQRLPRLVGPGHAALMIMTGRVVGAAEAARIGLVNEVFPGPDAAGAMQRWAAQLAERPSAALFAAKAALVAAHRVPLLEGLRVEQELFLQVLGTTVETR